MYVFFPIALFVVYFLAPIGLELSLLDTRWISTRKTFYGKCYGTWSPVVMHYSDVIMSTIASQFTSVSIVYSTVCSGPDQRKHQSSASLAVVRGIHRWPVDSPHKGQQHGNCFHLITSSWTNFCLHWYGGGLQGNIFHLSFNINQSSSDTYSYMVNPLLSHWFRYWLGANQYKPHLTSIGIPIIKIKMRRSNERLLYQKGQSLYWDGDLVPA